MTTKQNCRQARIDLLPALVMFASLVSLSCGTARRHQSLTPEAVLQVFLSRPVPVSCAAKLKLWIKIKGEGGGKAEMEVYRNSAGIYSFHARDLWGRNAMSAVIKPDSILVYYPQQRQFIHDSIRRFAVSDYWKWDLSPRDLLELIDGKWVADLKEVTVLEGGKDYFRYQARTGSHQVNFEVSKSEGILRELILIDAAGDTAHVRFKGTREYKEYHRPKLVELMFQNSNSSIKIGVLEEQFDLLLPESFFSIEIPETAQRIPLD